MTKKTLPTNAMLETEEDFTEAYESYGQRIYRFLFWRTKDSELSADLTSDVFTKAWRSRASYSGGSVGAWLYRIAHNTLTDHWRKRQDLPTDDIEAFGEVEDTTAERLDTAMQVERLQGALAALPKGMRTVVELRFIKGLSAKQVGEQLGMSDGNVRIIQYRALKRIRKQLL